MEPQAIADQVSLTHTVKHDNFAVYDDERINKLLPILSRIAFKGYKAKNW